MRVLFLFEFRYIKVFDITVDIVMFVGKRVKDSYSKAYERDSGYYNIHFFD
jgi:hypothetical protein